MLTPSRPVLALALATAIGSLGLAAGGIASVLLGRELAGGDAAVGLPVGLLVAGSAASALLIARTSGRLGRHRSLAAGCAAGAVGAVLAVGAAVAGSFVLLLFGSIVLGAGNAAIFLTRYAAADLVEKRDRGRTLSTVLVATAVGAIAGPFLLGPSGDAAGAIGLPPLSGLYLVAIPAFVVAALLLMASSARAVPVEPTGGSRLNRREVMAGLNLPRVRFALAILAVTNLVMVGIMTIAPVHLAHRGHGLDLVGLVVGIHVAGMFLPSPVSGWAADRIGPALVASLGVGLLVVVGIAGLGVDQDSIAGMTMLLALLGVGWNAGVVGASTLLTVSVPAALRPYVEGVGEGAMGIAAAGGAPISGVLVASGGLTTLLLVVATVSMVVLVVVWQQRSSAFGSQPGT